MFGSVVFLLYENRVYSFSWFVSISAPPSLQLPTPHPFFLLLLHKFGASTLAAKILANLVVMGSGIMIRAFSQAYRQTLTTTSMVPLMFRSLVRLISSLVRNPTSALTTLLYYSDLLPRNLNLERLVQRDLLDDENYLFHFLINAAKILANLVVMGSGIMIRAFAQAYRQALANASKNGVAQEAVKNTIHRASKSMTEQEARQILGVTDKSAWEEILKKYDVLFESNAKQGSFYLQSKVHRAKECLEVPKERVHLLLKRTGSQL
ncbi:hypothetical protein V2J09_009804 [Rumex salicifolius]